MGRICHGERFLGVPESGSVEIFHIFSPATPSGIVGTDVQIVCAAGILGATETESMETGFRKCLVVAADASLEGPLLSLSYSL